MHPTLFSVFAVGLKRGLQLHHRCSELHRTSSTLNAPIERHSHVTTGCLALEIYPAYITCYYTAGANCCTMHQHIRHELLSGASVGAGSQCGGLSDAYAHTRY
jgi:hypothetical protein